MGMKRRRITMMVKRMMTRMAMKMMTMEPIQARVGGQGQHVG